MVFEAVTCDGLGCVANKQTNKQTKTKTKTKQKIRKQKTETDITKNNKK